MTDFDEILDRCLSDLMSGASTLDECLLRHPEHSARLKPFLQTAIRLHQGVDIHPSAVFRAQARARLSRHMLAHPRRGAWTNFTIWRFAAALAVLVLALLSSGTAYAQTALPGDPFYEWKLASERAWRAISPDPLKTDIAIANRRIDEINAVADDPVRRAQALEGYLEVLVRLKSELDAETLQQILPAVDPVEPAGQPVPTSLPDGSRTPQPEAVNTPLPSYPEVVPTNIPNPIPTIVVPPVLP
ncbi:MAG: hypothetical protein DPW18_16740 [Chloroflexi bacterium]|nr:MAG: hypothetical protein EDM79_11415 [Chloroflexota bacterium]MCE7859112.1 hypothetical protein [Chloroflexi bacterium CFX2]MCQ3938672.1 hypothetical protein [Chloroflexota bacterium]MDL1944646.1 hypothetical protein [Chloroflexi bacterium CFX2]